MQSEPVIFIDLPNLIFRSGYAHQLLKDEEGRPTGVLFGALRTIADLRETVSRRIIPVWDHGVPVPGAAKPRNWRDAYIDGYKANRKRDDGMYQKILAQCLDLHRAINLLGYRNAAVMGMEADDVIGIVSKAIPDEVLIFSTDKDLYQLLDEVRVHVLVPKKDRGEFRRVRQSDVERENGIDVDRWAEYLALGGDHSDNIKPIPGMGPKTAIKLIQSGVDLRKPFQEQPETFRASKYGRSPQNGASWAAIQRSYAAAKIPIDRMDPRIYRLWDLKAIPDGEQRWPSPDAKRNSKLQFEKFCAERDLNTVFALRHRLFDTSTKKENPPCATIVKSPKKPQRRSLFDTSA